MRVKVREFWNHSFTFFSCLSVALLVLALLIFLFPMLGKGLPAIVFRGTVEFRKLQYDRHHRGDEASLQKEIEKTDQVRAEVYALLDQFSRGIDTESLADEAKGLYRQYGDELRYQEVPRDSSTRN